MALMSGEKLNSDKRKESFDLKLFAADYENVQIPHDKKYLLKYFRNEKQIAILRYLIVFDCVSRFRQHTGIDYSDRMCFKMQTRYRYLIKTYEDAKKEFTFESMKLLQDIEMGQFKLPKYL